MAGFVHSSCWELALNCASVEVIAERRETCKKTAVQSKFDCVVFLVILEMWVPYSLVFDNLFILFFVYSHTRAKCVGKKLDVKCRRSGCVWAEFGGGTLRATIFPETVGGCKPQCKEPRSRQTLHTERQRHFKGNRPAQNSINSPSIWGVGGGGVGATFPPPHIREQMPKLCIIVLCFSCRRSHAKCHCRLNASFLLRRVSLFFCPEELPGTFCHYQS